MSDRGDFGLHVRLGRKRNRHIRLTRASLVLLAAALLGWFSGLPPLWHVSLSLAAGLVGLVWPVRGSFNWALHLITEESGLAYETALQTSGQPRDEFGLSSQVRARARRSIAGMSEPRSQDWWLAALLLALFILALPALRLDAPWRSTPAEPPPEPPPAVAGTDDVEEDPQADSSASQPEQADPELPPQATAPPESGPEGGGSSAGSAATRRGRGSPGPAVAGTDNVEEDPQADSSASQPEQADPELPPQATAPPESGPESGASSAGSEATRSERESQVLDRFLDNLRERPPESGADASLGGTPLPADPDSTTPELQDDTPGDGSMPAEDEPQEVRDQPADGQEPASGEGDREGDGQEGPEGDAQQEGPGSEQPGGESGPQPGEEESESAGQSPQPGEEGGMGLSAGEDEADGAGASSGPEGLLPGRDEQAAQGEEEFLEGELAGSEVNLGGDIRLPGFTDVELPPGSAPGTYGEAVERALTGGNVPLEYQEIIRNYFR